MKITNPKWVKKANQWCITTIQPTENSKHNVKQTQYWFSSEDEVMAKAKELSDKENESKNVKTTT